MSTEWTLRGLWLLPVWGALTLGATITHQPDPAVDFVGYAEYVTTPLFLLGHLVGSILGTAVGVLGLVALTAHLQARAPGGRAIAALALSVVGLTLVVSLFGVAAFAQPAIGDAALAGRPGARELDDAVYGGALTTTGLVGVVLYAAGSVLFGLAVRRAAVAPRWSGALLAASGPLIAVFGLAIGPAQTVGSLALIASGWAIARAAQRGATRRLPVTGRPLRAA